MQARDQKIEDTIHGVIVTFLDIKELKLGVRFIPPKAEIVLTSLPSTGASNPTHPIQSKEMNFLGTWKTFDGRTAIVVSKGKYVVPQTRKEQVIWIGFITTGIIPANATSPVFMTWLENGKSFYGMNHEDLVEAVRVKA